MPFRTSVQLVEAYDGLTVAEFLEIDFEHHGAPLALRLDRAKQHRVDRVLAVCAKHQVLILHGPPHCPRFYGQQERQNREHRAWLDDACCRDRGEVMSELGRMRVVLNSHWPRRTLGWRTAEDVWAKRPKITLDRAQLRAENFAERLAIEIALTRRGLLCRNERGDC